MNCINWVVSEKAQTDPDAKGQQCTTTSTTDANNKVTTTTTCNTSLSYKALGGYKRWSEGDPVTFYWFDGRNLDKTTPGVDGAAATVAADAKCDEVYTYPKDPVHDPLTTCYYEKMAKQDTTLKYDASKNAFQLAIGATAIIFTAVTFAF